MITHVKMSKTSFRNIKFFNSIAQINMYKLDIIQWLFNGFSKLVEEANIFNP